MIPQRLNEYTSTIQSSAAKYLLEESLICAVIMTESGGNTWTNRIEPAWKYFYKTDEFAVKNGITRETETIMQSMSHGLMQVMGSVARELGFAYNLSMLYLPSIGIDCGCKKLISLRATYKSNLTDMISAYNGGSVVKNTDGTYRNQGYVDKVMGFYKQFNAPSP